MLPSRPSFATGTNVYGEIWTSHRSLGYLDTSSKGQTPRFHTVGFVQGLKTNLDEHRRVASMFQQAAEYNTQMTNIMLRFFDLEIRNKQIIKEKDKFVQNLQGALEKEQKLKAKLQVKKHENYEVLTELQIVRHKINDMEKHNKDLEMIRMEINSLQVTLTRTDANYQKLKTKKDSLSVEHNKLQRDYKNM